MSRRLRIEEEKLKQLKEEEDEVLDRHTIQQRRIYTPLMWKRTSTGFRIEDITQDKHAEILEIFRDYYMDQDVLCRNTELKNDEVSLEQYFDRLRLLLKANNSIIAVDETPPFIEEIEEEIPEGLTELEKRKLEREKIKKRKELEERVIIAGVLILRVLHKREFARVYSRVRLIQGEALGICQRFKNYINRKVDVYEELGCDSVLRYYDLCILPQYRRKGLGFQMMRAALEVARSLKVPAVIGLFPNYRLQKCAEKLGMRVLYEINYIKWKDEEGELIFDDPGAGNYTCALMGGQVPPGSPRILPKPVPIEVPKHNTRLSRADRRQALITKPLGQR